VGEWRKKLSVVCINVVVQGKGGDDSTARRSVGLHDEKQGTQNGALKNTTVGGIQG